MINLNWHTCGDDGHWCDFSLLDLSSIDVEGVYIIWHEGQPGRVVRVGQGNIADRIAAHRNNPEIAQYAASGTLRVTWAAVHRVDRDGVERHLADTWDPLVGDAFPDVDPIAVNSPF